MPATDRTDSAGASGTLGLATVGPARLSTISSTLSCRICSLVCLALLGLLGLTEGLLPTPAHAAGLGLGGQVVRGAAEAPESGRLFSGRSFPGLRPPPDPTAPPLAGVTVELLPLLDPYRAGIALLEGTSPRPIDATTTDQGGFYRVEAPEAGLWLLRLSAPGRETRVEPILAYLSEEEHEALGLAPARDVTVRVVDPDGQPVAGARVVAWTDTAAEPLDTRGGRTDDAGQVTVAAAAGEAQPLRLLAHASGFAPSAAVDVSGTTTVVRLRRGIPRAVEVLESVGGAVGGGSHPVADALVRVGDAPGLPVGRTGEDGRLEILAPLHASLPVQAVTADLRTARAQILPPEAGRKEEGSEQDREHPQEDPDEPEDLPPVSLRLDAPVTVSGLVVDRESRTPLAGALLWIPDAGQVVTTSDRAGGFRLALLDPPDEPFAATVLLAGYRPHRTLIRPEQLGGRLPTFPLQPASAIAGTVVNIEGAPVAGAQIQVSGQRRRTGGLARSGKDGAFLVAALPPGGPVRLRAEKSGYAPTSERLPLLEPRQTLDGVRLVLRRGRSAVGQVLSPEDEPVAGAEVSLFPHVEDSSMADRYLRFRNRAAPPLGHTDGRGEFRVDHLAPGRYDLAVEAQGFAAAEVPGIDIPDGDDEPIDVGTVVLEEALPVEGRVVDPSDQPVAGALVEANDRSPGGPPRWNRWDEGPQATTGADGRFSFGDFRPGTQLSLQVSRDGYAAQRVRGVEIPYPEPLTIVLQPGARIQGKVVDPRDRPIEGAYVRIDAADRSLPRSARRRTQTDADGRFSLTDVPPGEITVEAQARGYLGEGRIHLDLAPGSSVEDLAITLQPGATVVGEVRGPHGEPLPEVQVSLVQSGGGFRMGQSSGTNGDGEFRLEGIPEGPQTFRAFHDNFPEATRDLEVRSGENRLDFRFEAGHAVSGHARMADGGPVAGASLWLHSTSRGRGRQTLSGSDGSFTFEGVGDGQYFLHGQHPEKGEALDRESFTVQGSGVSGLEVRFGGRGRIVGEVVGLGLDDLAEVEIRAFRSEGGNRWAQPDFEGRFELDGLSPGSWNVFAFAPGGRQVRERVELAEDGAEAQVVLELGGGFSLTGRVLVGSEPLDQGSVQVLSLSPDSRLGAGSAFAALSHDGRFRIDDLAAGSYRVRVSNSRGLEHHEELELESDRDLLIELTAGRIVGRVTDAVTGEPLGGVQVQLAPVADESPPSRFPGAPGTVTDVTGSFRMTSVSAGSYRLVVRREGYSRAERQVTIDSSSPTSVEMAMEPSESVTLQVSWAPGLIPSSWVRVQAFYPDGRPSDSMQAAVGDGGTVRLKRLSAGVWDLYLSSSGSALTPVRVTVPGPTASVTLAPEARLDVDVPALAQSSTRARLEVVDAAGRPLALYNGATRQPLLGGRTVVTGLPTGPLTVRVTADDGRVWSASTTVVAGQTGRLTLE